MVSVISNKKITINNIEGVHSFVFIQTDSTYLELKFKYFSSCYIWSSQPQEAIIFFSPFIGSFVNEYDNVRFLHWPDVNIINTYWRVKLESLREGARQLFFSRDIRYLAFLCCDDIALLFIPYGCKHKHYYRVVIKRTRYLIFLNITMFCT